MNTVCCTVKQASKSLHVDIKHVYYLLYMGRLEGWKIRGTWRIFINSIELYDSTRNTRSA